MAGADSADRTDRDASRVDGGRRKLAGGGVTRPHRGPIKYFTSAGPKSGLILWREDCATIDVLSGAGDDTPWEISPDYAKVPGRWIVLGRELLPKK
jgi:hypothetical protein